MDQENIMFMGNQDNLYRMIDLYQNNRFFGYKDSYNYYDIDVDKILLFKKSNNEYIIRYNDVNKMTIVPLQLKIKNFFGELHTYTNNKRNREKWNKITELIGINNAQDFVETTLDDGDEFIMVDVLENTSVVRGNYRSKLVIVLHFVIDDYLQSSLMHDDKCIKTKIKICADNMITNFYNKKIRKRKSLRKT